MRILAATLIACFAVGVTQAQAPAPPVLSQFSGEYRIVQGSVGVVRISPVPAVRGHGSMLGDTPRCVFMS